ncbi:hypothetical protein BKA70DRAFT_1473099 [Coprinopsis sp. MPI-PUGE-AT-0042]|nr:hypothetical protein BKA70DRAFT_1473099 [Coprinopsis sp. MPI-PUGE-AT-0042]
MQLPLLISVFFAYMSTVRAAPVPPQGDGSHDAALEVAQSPPNVGNHAPAPSKPIPIPGIKSHNSRAAGLPIQGLSPGSPRSLSEDVGSLLGKPFGHAADKILDFEAKALHDGVKFIDDGTRSVNDVTKSFVGAGVKFIDNQVKAGSSHVREVTSSYFEAFGSNRSQESRDLHWHKRQREGEGEEYPQGDPSAGRPDIAGGVGGSLL